MGRPPRGERSAGAWREPADGVRLEDVAAADRLAREAASPFGRALPARELLATFGGDGPEGRRRAQTALELAGVAADPPLARAAPHELVTLRPVAPADRPTAAAPPPRRRAAVAALGALGLAAVLVVALLLRGAVGDDGPAVAWTTPAGDGAPAATAPAAPATTAADAPARPAREAPARTVPDVAARTPPEGQARTAPAAPDRGAAPGARRGRSAPDGREGARAAPAPASERRRRRPRAVRLRIEPTEPSYVCVAEDDGTPIFHGMLAEPLTVRRARLRLRIGVGTARITANGRPLAVRVAPSNFLLTPRGARLLPAGQRMCA